MAAKRRGWATQTNSIREPVETKGMEKKSHTLRYIVALLLIKLALFEVFSSWDCWHRGGDAYEANKFFCQPRAESLYRHSNEPGENVKEGKMKQTLWSISCSTSWISNSSSARQSAFSLQLRGRGQNCGWEKRGDIRWVSAWGFSQKHMSEIFNLTLINSCLFQAQDWIILYGNAIMLGIITCSPGDLVYSSCLLLTMTGALPREQPRELISDNPWFTSSSPPLFSDTLANQLKGRVWQLLTSYSI